MPLISLCINVDTRPPRNEQGGIFNGAVDSDFLTDGVLNKINFLKGFDIETIVFIDEHLEVSNETLNYLRSICDTVVVRKHTGEVGFNDYNYLGCFSLARGKYLMHFDQDTAAFTSSTKPIQAILDLLESYKFISYPSIWSPYPVEDNTFQGYFWASTRFFVCKRETVKLDELAECIKEPKWGYQKYGDRPRRCNWVEHFLTLINNNSVYYPPLEMDKYTIFTWEKYETNTLKIMNEYTYDQIYEWHKWHPMFYPNNCNC